VSTVAELLTDKQLLARDYWQDVGGRRSPAAFVKASACPLSPLGPPPALGQGRVPVSARSAARELRASSDAARSSGALPLAGVNIVDLTWVYAGPLATRVLADFGATVVKVEGPLRSDGTRAGGGNVRKDYGPEGSLVFAHLNAGKLGLTVDLNTERGRDVLLDLVRWADVLAESYAPGTMQNWGVGYDALRAVNPRLVMLSTTLMGQSGPLADYAGFGNLAAAMAGFYELTGWPDRSPAGPFVAYTDYVSPRFAVAAVLAALDWRRRTGLGQHLDLSQAEASIHFLGAAIAQFGMDGVGPTRVGNGDPFVSPHGVFPCAGDDRWVAIACENDEHRRALAGVTSDLSDAGITAWCQERGTDEIEATLQSLGVPVHGVQNSGECWTDPQLVHRHHFLTVPHPVHDQCVIEGPRVVLSRTPGRTLRAGPALGEHNDVVLREILGYDDARISELALGGVLG
jgi:benzylsuccinate CoA-transferase BbsF subunit